MEPLNQYFRDKAKRYEDAFKDCVDIIGFCESSDTEKLESVRQRMIAVLEAPNE